MVSVILTILMVHLVAVMSPGPDFFFVSQTAMSRSRAESLAGATGITLGVVFWAGLSMLGLQWIFERFAWLHEVLLLLGGLYLTWMGYQLLKSSLRPSTTTHAPLKLEHSAKRAFLFGLLTNLANAKALVYFTSVFAFMLTPDITGEARLLLFVLLVLETWLWFIVVALVFGLPKMRLGYQRLSRGIDGLAGALFTGFGLKLIYDARRLFV